MLPYNFNLFFYARILSFSKYLKLLLIMFLLHVCRCRYYATTIITILDYLSFIFRRIEDGERLCKDLMALGNQL
jgi:hypothetical protein